MGKILFKVKVKLNIKYRHYNETSLKILFKLWPATQIYKLLKPQKM